MGERRPWLHRRWVRVLLLVLGVLLLGLVATRAALPGLLERRLARALAQGLNVDLTAGEVDLDLTAGRAQLRDVRATLDGELLATCPHVTASAGVAGLLRGEGGTIAVRMEGLEAWVRVEGEGRINLARIAPRGTADDVAADVSASDGDAARILLDIRADDAVIHYLDAVTEPDRPLELTLERTTIGVTQIRLAGPAEGAPLTDAAIAGAVPQDDGPALLGATAWWGAAGGVRDLELHAALTGFDLGTVPQYVTPRAGTVLGGDTVHVAVTTVARGGTIEEGLVELEVDGADSALQLPFGGSLDAPVFEADSALFEAFRLSYLRVVDSGSDALAFGRDLGVSLWDRSAAMVSEAAGGFQAAVAEGSLGRLGEGIRKGVSSLFGSEDTEEDAQALVERWNGYAARQLAFRRLCLERRIDVAREREPQRVARFEGILAGDDWQDHLAALPTEESPPGE